MTTKAQHTEQAEALERIRECVKPGDTLYCVLRHVSKSGMSRVIDLKKIDGEQVLSLGWNVAKALGYKYDRDREGVKVSGCGMDMGFALVYALGRTLWPQGFTLAPHQHGRNGDTSGFDEDGGYALQHRWL